jgi:hypothetical protein
MLSHTQRTFLPDADNSSNAGAEMTLTIEERKVITFGTETNAVEFFDKRSNRAIRAVMGSNRADFLS